MNSIKLTIITVSYNAVNTIEQTISSVVNQSYPNIEYIIIDGGSTDGTVDIIKKYKDKIAYWISEPDDGIYGAMNKGIKVATGDYIQIIGADDCLLSDSVIDMVARDIIAKKADIYSYGILCVDEQKHKEKYVGNKHARKNPKNYAMVPHGGMIVRRELYLNNLFDIGYKISADYKFFLQCYKNPDITFAYYDAPIIFFSLSGVSATSQKYSIEEDKKICEEFGIEFLSNPSTGIRFYVKEMLKFVGVLSFCKSIRDRLGWKRHKCNNKICRWCRRYNP